MPSIIDSTVVASAYTTSASARPQRLSNGWIVSVEFNTSTYYLQVSKDNGASWQQLCTISDSGTTSSTGFSIVCKGTIVYVIFSYTTTNIVYVKIDASTQTNINVSTSILSINGGQTATGGCSLVVDSTGNYLHACWSSKNATYANSFNIRYAKGTIASDGSVTWGSIEQVTTTNSSSFNYNSPSIIVNKNNYPVILSSLADTLTPQNAIFSFVYNGTTWSANSVYTVNLAYAQSSPSAIFVPQSINGLANGRIWVAWHGLDATDTTTWNLRVSYSDDLGVTWSAMTKLTSGNLYYSQMFPSITCNKANEISIVWNNYYQLATLHANLSKIKNISGIWQSIVQLTSYTTSYAWYPSTLYDPNFTFTEPLFIYQNSQSAKVGFYGTWTTTTISVTQGSIGTKADKTNLLSYAITTDGTMSTITESVNGVVIGTKTATSGQSLIAGLTQAQWDAIKYGKYSDATGDLNTLTVNMGTDTFTYTFDKRLATTDDITHAMQAVQDSGTTFLPSVKAKLANAIRNKGGTINDTDSWDTMVSALNTSNSGRKANGSVTGVSYKAIVSGLTFTPSIVILKSLSSTGANQSISVYVPSIASSSISIHTDSSVNAGVDTTNVVNMGGFNVNVFYNISYIWIAYE